MNYRYSDLNGRTAAISQVASRLASKGMILVNSAGNDGMGTWKKINVPADAHDILTVGAVSLDKVNAPFSSIGPTADGRIKPDVMLMDVQQMSYRVGDISYQTMERRSLVHS